MTVVVVACSSLLISIASTKQYTSSSTLFVSAATDDAAGLNQGGQFSMARVQSYADLVSGRDLAAKVIDELGLDISPSELVGLVSAKSETNTVNLTVSAVHPDPNTAQLISQTYAEALTGMIRELETPPGKLVAPVKATIVDQASIPGEPTSPRTIRNVATGIILGLLAGFSIALIRELLDTKVKSPTDLAAVTTTPLLGTIGYDSEAKAAPLISSMPMHSPRSEAFRMLRTNLQFVDVDQPNKIMVVASALPEEGKTSTAVNLAISMAQAGVRTLLIEGDLRRPRAARRLEVDGDVGVTSVLVGRVAFPEAVQRGVCGELDFLAAGPTPPNPAELLQSGAMRDLLSSLREEYEIVIVDAPPLLPVTDAALIASQSDGVLMVVRHGRITQDQLRTAIGRLDKVGAKLFGTVLNMVPIRDGVQGYGYGYGYGYAPDAVE